MVGKLLCGAPSRRGRRLSIALCAGVPLLVLMCAVVPVRAQTPPYANQGLRWIGKRTLPGMTCTAPVGWSATPLFKSGKLPVTMASLCRYRWALAGAPTVKDVTNLASWRFLAPRSLTEDVPVLSPSAAYSPEETAFFAGLRAALRKQVGGVGLLPAMPPSPVARIVVIDTAPDALHGQIRRGASRHGDTLAHLIEDLVCVPELPAQPADPPPRDPGLGPGPLPAMGPTAGAVLVQARRCAAEVTSVLAMPVLSAAGDIGPDGGYMGTLADLAAAIQGAVATWEKDREQLDSAQPSKLILNISLGWEHHAGYADCSTGPFLGLEASAKVVHDTLQYAAARGVLIIAAAGNQAGGPSAPTGLVCPGKYQSVPQTTAPSEPLLVAVSGVDYQDHPLQTARQDGITGITALGLGGAAWAPADPVAPPLTGSSVSTAVVSAVSALVWAARPTWTPRQVTTAVYEGGMPMGNTPTFACPLLLSSCNARRASTCGALTSAGVTTSQACPPAAPLASSSPLLFAQVAALTSAFASASPVVGSSVVPSGSLPHDSHPGLTLQPWTFPMPVAETCSACRLASSQLYIPDRDQDLVEPVLLLKTTGGTTVSWKLQLPDSLSTTLDKSVSYSFPMPGPFVSASISATTSLPSINASNPTYSIQEQIFVQP